MAEERMTVATWLKRHVTDSTCRVSLVLLMAGAGTRTLSVWEGESELDPERLDEICDEIAAEAHATAQQNTDATGRTALYAVSTWESTEPGATPRATCPAWRVKPAEDASQGDEMPFGEPPTTTGQLAQTQRHLENLVGKFLPYFTQQMDRMNDQIDRYQEREIQVMEKMDAWTKRVYDLTEMKHIHELEMRREEEKERSRKETFAKFSPILDGFIGKLMSGGKPAQPGDPAFRQHIGALEQVVEQVFTDEERLKKFEAVVGPENMIAIVNAFQGLGVGMEEEEAPALPKRRASRKDAGA